MHKALARGPKGDCPDESPSDLSDHILLHRLRLGHPDASTALYLRYARRLHRLAQKQTSPDLARRVDPDDIVQSVFRTFFRRAVQGHYEVSSGEELWKLLLVIALNKVRAAGEFHRAAKRDVRLTLGGAAYEHAMQSATREDQTALVVLRLVIEQALEGLPAILRRIVELRMEGYEVAEISREIKRSKRTVERILKQFRERLQNLIEAGE